MDSSEFSEFEVALKNAVRQYLNRSETDRSPRLLEEAIEYSLLSPGKRIRPRVLFATAELLGLPVSKGVSAAIALEMIHCFTLIHDDLPCMDNDDFRRGMPTNHKKFGEEIALLAGDALIPLAVEVFLDSPVEAPQLMTGLKRLLWATGPRGVVGGQAAECRLNSEASLTTVREIHRMKTGALFSAAVLIPKDFSKVSDQSRKGQALIQFADALGLAFQAADDLEDLTEVSLSSLKSVLHYQTPSEAATQAIESLQASISELQSLWGDAGVLQKISNEVVQKIRAALPKDA